MLGKKKSNSQKWNGKHSGTWGVVRPQLVEKTLVPASSVE